MEKPPVNSVNKVELPKIEQKLESFSLSEQEKNIQEVFKLSPELKKIACDSLGIENDQDIIIELGRNKENNLGKIQNINVYYKGEKIINSDEQDSTKLYLVTKKDGTSYVGDIFIPTELQGQGLAKKILKKVADNLDTKITPTYLSTGGFTSENAKKMWEKIGNEILPNHEAEKLYAEYLKTIFPESKVQDVLYHGTNKEFDKFSLEFLGENTNNKYKSIFLTPDIETAKKYGKKIIPCIANIIGDELKSLNDIKNLILRDSKLAKEHEEDFENINFNEVEEFLMPSSQENDTGKSLEEYLFELKITGRQNENKVVEVFDPSQIHILGSKSDIEKFKEFVSKNNEGLKKSFLNEWDKKYLKKGTIGMVENIYKDFENNFPDVILLPERGARPLYYLLKPIFEKLSKDSGSKIPKFVYFSVSKKAGINLGIFEQYDDIKNSDDLTKTMLENYPEMPMDTIQKLVDKEKVEEVMLARENMKNRAKEINKKISKENIRMAIIDEVLSTGRTIEEIRKAFNNQDILAYTIVALNDGYAPLTESGYRFSEESDEKNPNPKVKGYSFSFEQEEDAIGVNKSIYNKYSLPIKKSNVDEQNKVEKEKKNLRQELNVFGNEISREIII
jgi:predicted GNAT family acetyltransferase